MNITIHNLYNKNINNNKNHNFFMLIHLWMYPIKGQDGLLKEFVKCFGKLNAPCTYIKLKLR